MATAAVIVEVEEEPFVDEAERERKILEASGAIVGRLSSLASDQVREKSTIEERWHTDLRNYHGKYDDTTHNALKEEKRSTAFVTLTRAKTNAWAARLSDMLFPTDDKNWGIAPTPLPELAEAAKASLAEAKSRVDEANATLAAGDPARAQQVAAMADAFAQEAKQSEMAVAEAKRRAERMETAIEDQFIESDYVTQCRDVIEDGCRLGTGILKGPLTSNRIRQEWRPDPAIGDWRLVQIPDPMPEFRRVDPWHFFPDMSARTIQEAEFTFERSLPTKKDLRKFALKLDFNRDAVGRLLKDGPKFPTEDLSHLTALRTITGEGEAIKDRYVMWEYHGPLECDEIAALLRATGDEEGALRVEEQSDPLEEYRVILFFINNEVLKIAPEYPLDSGDTLYSVWNFEKGETSIFGFGVPHLMNNSQRSVNGAWRMMMDNAGLSVGPQLIVDKNVISPQDGNWGLRPYKLWLMNSASMLQPNQNPFQAVNIPNNQEQLGGIINMARVFIDEETSMPQVAQGEQGATPQTLGATAMIFNSANVVFRRVVKAWDDDLTKPTIRRAYQWNMQFHPDESIKGDMQVDARGTSVLLVREVQSQNLMAIMTTWTQHPALAPYLKVREGMVKTFQTMMIDPDDLILSQEEYDKQVAEAQAAAQAQQPQQVDDSATRLQIAEMDANTRLQVAQANRETALIQLASRENMTIAELQNKLQLKELENDFRARKLIAEVAVEDQRTANAAVVGQSPVDAAGQGIG